MFCITFFPSPPFPFSFVILLLYYYYFLYILYNIIRRRETKAAGGTAVLKFTLVAFVTKIMRN